MTYLTSIHSPAPHIMGYVSLLINKKSRLTSEWARPLSVNLLYYKFGMNAGRIGKMAKNRSINGKNKSPGQHPSGDERYNAIDLTMKRFKHEKDALLEVLHSAQETFGFLSEELLIYISCNLGVPLSQVYGVATFYHLFTFEPLGKHNCIICTGTACHVKGAAAIVSALSDRFDIDEGTTSEDGLFSLSTARCLGSCGIAPVAVLNGKVLGKVVPKVITSTIEGILAEERASVSKAETGP